MRSSPELIAVSMLAKVILMGYKGISIHFFQLSITDVAFIQITDKTDKSLVSHICEGISDAQKITKTINELFTKAGGTRRTLLC